jgi:CheY-specific phosphatase CheX
MDKETLKTAMTASISEVLEKMFFIPLELPEGVGLDHLQKKEAQDQVAIRLAFNGPFSGHFAFFVPVRLASSMSADFLGVDEAEVTETHRIDMVKEIGNMIAGNTFSHLDSQAVFDLGIPETIPFDTIKTQYTDSPGTFFIPIQTLEGDFGLILVIGG